MKYLIDSSAWIEYLEGSDKGEKVNSILNGNNEIIIIPLNIAEVISKIKRKNGDVQLAYHALIKNANVVQITPKIANEAGILHAEKKNNISSFSLADALIITAAKTNGATIVTKDNHFKNLSPTYFL